MKLNGTSVTHQQGDRNEQDGEGPTNSSLFKGKLMSVRHVVVTLYAYRSCGGFIIQIYETSRNEPPEDDS